MTKKDPTHTQNAIIRKNDYNNHMENHDDDHDHDEPNQFMIFMGLNVIICIVGYIIYIMKMKWS